MHHIPGIANGERPKRCCRAAKLSKLVQLPASHRPQPYHRARSEVSTPTYRYTYSKKTLLAHAGTILVQAACCVGVLGVPCWYATASVARYDARRLPGTHSEAASDTNSVLNGQVSFIWYVPFLIHRRFWNVISWFPFIVSRTMMHTLLSKTTRDLNLANSWRYDIFVPPLRDKWGKLFRFPYCFFFMRLTRRNLLFSL